MRFTSGKVSAVHDTSRHVRWVLLGITYALFALDGARQMLPEPTVTDYLLQWAMAFAIALTCIEDARAQGRPLSWGGGLLLLILLPVAVPFYMIQARGWRGLLWFMIHAIGLFATAIGTLAVVGFLKDGPAFFTN